MGYPRKKQSFHKEKDCFFSGTPNFFGSSYFEGALEKKTYKSLLVFLEDVFCFRHLLTFRIDNFVLGVTHKAGSLTIPQG